MISWHANMEKLAYLTPYLRDESIREILIHNQNFFQIEKNQLLEDGGETGLSARDYQSSLEILALQNQVEWNYKKPFTSFFIRLANIRFRASLVHFSITASHSSKLFLRRLNEQAFSLNSFTKEEYFITFLKNAILQKKNILISGATGSGKTALLSSLVNTIPPKEHVVVLEDTFEIPILNQRHTRLLSENTSGKTLEDYCAYSLRIRPDRIILGEMRSKETIPFLLAMNTGHQGLISTVHANSAVESLSRLAALSLFYQSKKEMNFSNIMRLICQGLDYVIHLNKRRIIKIIHILGNEKDRPFFEEIDKKDSYNPLREKNH
ncbi:MAG: CpaF/VirB11 family protein [Halobacteriovoraceae bacterium]|nr:CpaF/VirB11 family protein [Halobacteriovoraceae bacterium]